MERMSRPCDGFFERKTMGIATVPSQSSPMSETDLKILYSRLETIRLMSEVTAEGLDEVLPALDAELAHQALVTFDTILQVFGPRVRSEFARSLAGYRQLHDHTVIDRMAKKSKKRGGFFGFSRGFVVETYLALAPEDDDAPERRRARRFLFRRMGELCLFGYDYGLRPRHLHLVER
jgi:hypothetical protein